MQTKVSLKKYSSWGVGGYADFFCEPTSLEELAEAEAIAKKRNLNLTVIGRGTNSLISDEGIDGLVICTRKLVGIREFVNKKLRLECLAGTPKILVKKKFLDHGLSPALFLAGIPGDVAGGVVMNAGVSEIITPNEFGQIVDWVEVVENGVITRIEASDIEWTYRKSKIPAPGIITKVSVSWKMNKMDGLEKQMQEAAKNRLKKQPLDEKSCGSVFVNPKSGKAAKFIEECGLKGFRVGGAMVSTKHANFIINKENAKATDIDKIIKHIKNTVFTKKKIKLDCEIKYIGRWQT